MLSLGFEPTILTSERAKRVHALDRWATVPGYLRIVHINYKKKYCDTFSVIFCDFLGLYCYS
jgi:hypothetical protein